MTMIQIHSGAISEVEYHNKKEEFEVHFRDGTMTTYKKVPKNVYANFLKAESKGKFFNYNIRGVYADD